MAPRVNWNKRVGEGLKLIRLFLEENGFNYGKSMRFPAPRNASACRSAINQYVEIDLDKLQIGLPTHQVVIVYDPDDFIVSIVCFEADIDFWTCHEDDFISWEDINIHHPDCFDKIKTALSIENYK